MAHPHPNADAFSDYDGDDAESDRFTTMSLDAGSVASSSTSVDLSMRSASPTPSVMSITGSLYEQAYRQEYGRELNNYSDVYHLPADAEELDRLDKQFRLFCKIMGKYPPCLPQIMQDDGFEVKAILDLGCGSGSWIMDVAREFPDCTAVAVDLVPMQSISMPENCRSEVDDINLGLEHFYGDFNVVHCHHVSSGISDYERLIDQISHVLRPGGLIDCTEFPFNFAGLDKRPIFPSDGAFHPPWTPLFMSYVNRAIKQRGGTPDASLYIHEWISSQPAFENVVWREFWLPCSPWLRGNDPATRFWNDVGAFMRDDLKIFFKSGRPLLLRHGLQENFIDAMERNACKELDEATTPLYANIQNVYARKRH